MSWKIERDDPNGWTVLVGWVDDQTEIGTTIDEDRKKIDWEPVYKVTQE